MANLNQFNVRELANEGTVLELLNPFTGGVLTDEGEKIADKNNIKTFFVRLLGSDSDIYRSGMNRRAEKLINSKNKNKKVDLDEEKKATAKLLAKCTTDAYMIEDDKVIECTNSEMDRLYLKYQWMREQAEDYMDDRSNLMKS